jgi:hypothetical protein
MKKYILATVLGILATYAYSQKFQFGYSIGHGNYNLKELKDFQKDLTSRLDIDNLSVLENFPDHYFHSFEAGYVFKNNFEIGINWDYLYTGARSRVSDYSGRYSLDMQLDDYKYGMHLRYDVLSLLPSKQIALFLQFKTGFAFTTFEMKEEINIYEADTVYNSYTYKNSNFFVEPGGGVKFKLVKDLSISIGASYEHNFPNYLREKGNEFAYVYSSSGKKLKLDWSGFRYFCGLNYSF